MSNRTAVFKYTAIGLGLVWLWMMLGLPAVRLLYIPILLAGLYWNDRSWEKFNREHGIDIMKKLKRGASAIEIAQNADEQEAFRRERIRSLRERARTDPGAARDLRALLKTQIRSREQVLQELQERKDSGSGPIESAKSALSRDILELKGIQQETNRLGGS